MNYTKYIWVNTKYGKEHPNHIWLNVHLIVCYCQSSITAYKEMLKELKKDFPNANEDNVHCSKIVKSSMVANGTLLIFNIEFKEGDILPEGWTVFYDRNCEYDWA